MAALVLLCEMEEGYEERPQSFPVLAFLNLKQEEESMERGFTAMQSLAETLQDLCVLNQKIRSWCSSSFLMMTGGDLLFG